MIRKVIYALLAISFILAMGQLRSPESTSTAVQPGLTGQVEVRVTASPANEEVISANITVSSVEIHLPDGWLTMKLSNSNTFDLVQVKGLDEVLATADLNQGTYTQVRINITRVEVTLKGGQPKKVKLPSNKLTFTQNFLVTAKNTTVLLFNFDTEKSLNYSDSEKITFRPIINLLATRTPGAMGMVTRTPGAMGIITPNLPNGEVSVAYYAILFAFGGQMPYTWSKTMGDLPIGLNLDTTTGVISGTPTDVGNFTFTIRVDDDSPVRKNTTGKFTVNIAAAGALQIITGSLPNGIAKVAYSITLQAVGGTKPYTWNISIGSLPSSLTLNASTGEISGTPTNKGDFSFTVKVTDSANPANSDTQSLTIHIAQEVATS